MRRPGLLAGAAAALLLALAAATAFSAAPQAEDEPPFVHVTLDAREYSLGRSDAPLTLLEFTDYQCPYCRRFQAEAWPQIKKNYIDTGKLRFIVRDLPLQFHSSALPAAEAAHCAGEQGKFWEMHDLIYDGFPNLSKQLVGIYAKQLKLDLTKFNADLASHKYHARVAAEEKEGEDAGVAGTPTFYFNGKKFNGVFDVASVVPLIEKELGQMN